MDKCQLQEVENWICSDAGSINQRYLRQAAVTQAVERTADRLEESIMREAIASLLQIRHSRSHQHHPHHPLEMSLQSSACCKENNSRKSQLLTEFADDVASQIMKEASESAGRRLHGIYRIADSILQSISLIEPSNLEPSVSKGTDQSPCQETKQNHNMPDRRARLGDFAGSLTSQCLSEAFQSLKKSQPH